MDRRLQRCRAAPRMRPRRRRRLTSPGTRGVTMSGCGCHAAWSGPPHALDRGDDAAISAAAADIAIHVGDDLIASRSGVLFEQSGRLHDLARLAIAALRDLLGDPSLLQRVARIRRQAFDRRDLLAANIRQLRTARADGLSVDVDSAGAALSDAAAEFRPSQLEMLAYHPKQWRIGLCFHAHGFAVDRKCYRRHASLHSLSLVGRRIFRPIWRNPPPVAAQMNVDVFPKAHLLVGARANVLPEHSCLEGL